MDIPGSSVQRAVNAHAHLALERSGNTTIAQWQAHRLLELVQWLLQRVPWWRERLGPRFHLRDWASVPVLSRYTLRSMVSTRGSAAVPDHHGAVTPYFLAGPPGSPARFFTSAFSQTLVDHAFYADHRRQGRNPYAIQACISEDIPAHDGSHISIAASLETGTGIQNLRAYGLFKKAEHLLWLGYVQPAFLTTSPGWLEDALDDTHSQGIALAEVHQILTYGEAVPASLRSKARKQLGASVRHRYTCLECGPLAFQCPRNDDYFHVAVANALLEIVTDSAQVLPEGVPGRVLVTALHQYATPLVRHDIGDSAALHSQCPGCGLAAPTLSQLIQNV